jgi:hypothetical protein
LRSRADATSRDVTTDAPDAVTARATTTRPIVAAAVAVSVCLVLFPLYALLGTALLQGHRQHALGAATHFRLAAPDIGLDERVASHDSRSGLASGPALAPGSDRPGGEGPVVIVGHRVAEGGPFHNLASLRRGSTIQLRAGSEPPLTYSVDRVVSSPLHGQISEGPGGQLLVLATSSPAYHPTHALVVIARLVGGTPNDGAVSVRVPWGGPHLFPLIGAVALLGVLGTMWAWRERARPSLSAVARVGTWLSAAFVAVVVWELLLWSAPSLL